MNQQAPAYLASRTILTDTEKWGTYTEYWMNKTGEDYQTLNPEEKTGSLYKYTEYVLHKKALATRRQELTVPAAFEEYHEHFEHYSSSWNWDAYDSYKNFFVDTCSLNEEEEDDLD